MEQKICQSCGMPMNQDSDLGINSDQSKNGDYCCYCFKGGHFTENCTMEEMINRCAQFVEEFNKDSRTKLTKEEAISQMRQFFPRLKRWSTAIHNIPS